MREPSMGDYLIKWNTTLAEPAPQFGTRQGNNFIDTPTKPIDPLIEALLPEDREWLKAHGWEPQSSTGWVNNADGTWEYHPKPAPPAQRPRHKLEYCYDQEFLKGRFLVTLLLAVCMGWGAASTMPPGDVTGAWIVFGCVVFAVTLFGFGWYAPVPGRLRRRKFTR